MQLDPGLMTGLRLAVAADAHIAGGDALDAAVFVIEHFGGGESGKNFDPRLFRLAAEPAAEIAEADDVVARVVHLRRCRQAH